MMLNTGYFKSCLHRICRLPVLLALLAALISGSAQSYNTGDFGYVGSGWWGSGTLISKTATGGAAGANTITVTAGAGLYPGAIVCSGTGVAIGAKVTSVIGNTVFLSINNVGAVSGTIYFNQLIGSPTGTIATSTITFPSAPPGIGRGAVVASGTGLVAGTTVVNIDASGKIFTMSSPNVGNVSGIVAFNAPPYNWRTWNGASWAFPLIIASSFPSSTSDVYILSGDSVVAEGNGSVRNCKSLFVESGAILQADPLLNNNFYISVFGKKFVNNGFVGGKTAGFFNGISFNFESDTTTISSDSINAINPANLPLFLCSRIRKSTNSPNATTNLFIDVDMYLTFYNNSQTQIYNNASASYFNLTINKDRTVNLNNNGNIAIDGVTGTDAGDNGGTFTIKGKLYLQGSGTSAGRVYVSTNNSTRPCTIIIDSTGILNTPILEANISGAAKHTLTIRTGGRLEITNTASPWSAGGLFFNETGTNNLYNFLYNSTVAYIGNGPQLIANDKAYSNLEINSLPPGVKNLNGNTVINKNLTLINNAQLVPAAFTVYLGGNYVSPFHGTASTGFSSLSTDTIIFTGADSSLQNITTGDYETFYSLQVKNPYGVKLNIPLTIVDKLNLKNGKLELNGNRLSIFAASPTSITRTNGYVISENVLNQSQIKWFIDTVKGNYTFPFGTTAGEYIPVNFNLTSGNANMVTVSTYATATDNTPWPTTPVAVSNMISSTGLLPDNRSATVKRFWQVDATGTPTANVGFAFAATELPDSSGPWKLQRWSDTLWVFPASPQSSAGNTVTVTSMTEFGAIAITSVRSPLPIELLSFTAEPQGTVVLTRWTTGSEKNNDFFTVERMNSNGEIQKLGKVSGAGNSNISRDYYFLDKHPLPGKSYYRITQTDYDGKSESFKWVAVNYKTGRQNLVLYPNPGSSDEVHLINTDEDNNDLSYIITDINGRELRSGKLNSSNSISVKELSSGVYFFIFSSPKKDPIALRYMKD